MPPQLKRAGNTWPMHDHRGSETQPLLGAVKPIAVTGFYLSDTALTGVKDLLRKVEVVLAGESQPSLVGNRDPASFSFESDSMPSTKVSSQNQGSQGLEDMITDLPGLMGGELFAHESGEQRLGVEDGSAHEGRLTRVRLGETTTKNGRDLRMTALLDTGTNPNFIREGKARRTGYNIRAYDGDISYVALNGTAFPAIGQLVITWRFVNPHERPLKSYDLRFLVIPDSVGFDVMLGWKFLEHDFSTFMHNSSTEGVHGIFELTSSSQARSVYDANTRRRQQDQREAERAREAAEERARQERARRERARASASRFRGW